MKILFFIETHFFIHTGKDVAKIFTNKWSILIFFISLLFHFFFYFSPKTGSSIKLYIMRSLHLITIWAITLITFTYSLVWKLFSLYNILSLFPQFFCILLLELANITECKKPETRRSNEDTTFYASHIIYISKY